MKLSLTAQFNVVFLVIFILGFAGAGYSANQVLQYNAREEVLANARILMESAMSTRTYTQSQVVPTLQTQLRYSFLPQSVPSYSATEVLLSLQKKYPEFQYKEATLNPTNLRDRAVDWEVDVVQKLRENSGQSELIGDRESATGHVLYIARPIQIEDGNCLSCHSTVDAAPKTMIDAYGPNNGFGWRLHEVVGAQIVSVPATLAFQRAHSALQTMLISLLAVFAFVFVALNLMLRYIVTRRIVGLARAADKVSMGDLQAGDFPSRGRDEIDTLAESFGRMRNSLNSALKLLDE